MRFLGPSGDGIYYITTKAPEYRAMDNRLDRSIVMPSENRLLDPPDLFANMCRRRRAARIGMVVPMEIDLKVLRERLRQEEEHLLWYEQSGQRMDSSGVDISEQYLAGVRERIAKLKQQIADGGAAKD